LINNCVPIETHYFCEDCKSYFRRIVGDCISFQELKAHCPYCGSNKLRKVEEESYKETLSYVRHKIRKFIRVLR